MKLQKIKSPKLAEVWQVFQALLINGECVCFVPGTRQVFLRGTSPRSRLPLDMECGLTTAHVKLEAEVWD